MLSCGMLTSLADSMAAFSRMLPFGSPPRCLAATVISGRILEKSLPRCTSALPFLRLIWDHRECPDMASPSFLDGNLQPLDPLESARAPRLGFIPASLLGERVGREGRTRLRP